MPLKIVRNDIVQMNTEAIVNTANPYVQVGPGCDYAIYQAAGYDKLLAYRQENIGEKEYGDAFITPGFSLKASYIIHAVSPKYVDGQQEEEKKLRQCYRNSLKLAKENNIKSIAFPLIATGTFGYPKEEGLRIAVDEINSFLLYNDMEIYIVVFGKSETSLGKKLYPDLNSYIDQNYVDKSIKAEYLDFPSRAAVMGSGAMPRRMDDANLECSAMARPAMTRPVMDDLDPVEIIDRNIKDRLSHMSDTFSEYLLYLIEEKGLTNVEVYKAAVMDKRTFAKIKNNKDYHPQKLTALCLCMGARLNLDESIDLLARAGYAFSPCDKTDVVFKYFLENEIYDIIELDIQLEELGIPCIID